MVTSRTTRPRSVPYALKHELRNGVTEGRAHLDLDSRVLPRVDPAQACLRRNVGVAGKASYDPWQHVRGNTDVILVPEEG